MYKSVAYRTYVWLNTNGCFGSQAASRYFITWAAAYGQKRPFNALRSLDGSRPESTIRFEEQRCASSSPNPSDLHELRFVHQSIHTSILWRCVRRPVTALSFAPLAPKSARLIRRRSACTSVVPSSCLRCLRRCPWTNSLSAEATTIRLRVSCISPENP